MLEIAPLLRKNGAQDLSSFLVANGVASYRALLSLSPQTLDMLCKALAEVDALRLSAMVTSLQRSPPEHVAHLLPHGAGALGPAEDSAALAHVVPHTASAPVLLGRSTPRKESLPAPMLAPPQPAGRKYSSPPPPRKDSISPPPPAPAAARKESSPPPPQGLSGSAPLLPVPSPDHAAQGLSMPTLPPPVLELPAGPAPMLASMALPAFASQVQALGRSASMGASRASSIPLLPPQQLQPQPLSPLQQKRTSAPPPQAPSGAFDPIGFSYDTADRYVLWVDDKAAEKMPQFHELISCSTNHNIGLQAFASVVELQAWLDANAWKKMEGKLRIVTLRTREEDGGDVTTVRKFAPEAPIAIHCTSAEAATLGPLAHGPMIFIIPDPLLIPKFILADKAVPVAASPLRSSGSSPMIPVPQGSPAQKRDLDHPMSSPGRRKPNTQSSSAGYEVGFSLPESTIFVLWVDDKVYGKQDELGDIVTCSKRKKIGVHAFMSRLDMQVWVETNARDQKSRNKLRVVTNRFRKDDGGDTAGLLTVQAAKALLPDVPVIVYCGNPAAPGLETVRNKKSHIWVVTKKAAVIEFVKKGKVSSAE